MEEREGSIITRNQIIAVVVIDSVDDAVPTAQALIEGGINCIELALRTPAALEAMRLIRKNVPEMIIGAGTVIKPDHIHQVIDSGAHFGVSPGMNRNVVERALEKRFPFAPGIATPSDIEVALEYDLRILKFFPAEPMGGLKYLVSAATPYLHLSLQFVPLGGINNNNASAYLSSRLIPAIGGSWISDKTLISGNQWATITSNAREASIIAENAIKE